MSHLFQELPSCRGEYEVLNNYGYGTMRKIRDGSFNLITRWDYGKICDPR